MKKKNSFWKVATTTLATLACFSGCQTMSSWLPKHDKVTDARENAQARDVALSPDVSPEQKTNVELAVGQSLEDENQADQAAKIYLAIIKKDSQCTPAYQRLGLLYAKKGEWDLSHKYFGIALRKSPKDVELICDDGYAYYLQHRDEEAEQSFRRAISLDPGSSRAHNDLGLIMVRRGQENEALKEFCAGGCSEAQAHANLAMAYAIENRLPEARANYQFALSADPNLAVAKSGLAVLDSVDKKLGARRNVEETAAANAPNRLSSF